MSAPSGAPSPADAPPMITTISAPPPASPNPWSDPTPPPTAAPADDTETPRPAPLAPLSPSVYEHAVFAGPHEPPRSAPLSAAAAAVLSEFDPLESLEEAAARDAWAAAEGHPPPPPSRTPTPPATPPQPPVKDLSPAGPHPADAVSPTAAPASLASPPAATSSPFPSFASLARSFALPLARARPQSLDASARAVPSPATLSSFAEQQQAGTRQADAAPAPAPGSSGAVSPAPRAADGGFDFQKFLDQMKTKSADPVSKYLRSFLSNFAKRTFTVNDQVKIINDYLAFIAGQMRECDVWRGCSDADFENAMEGMEKLVMNRLYDFTFTPQLARAVPPRPITTDDLERDRVLAQRIALFGWLEEKHLDVPEGEGSKGFMMFAQQELLKINHYKAPRDKLICILNCCKVIFGLIRHLHKEEGADSFVPILIFVVLKANPEHLLSNVEFINRFRNPEKLQSEAGYYLSSLMGAVSFIESMDHTSLSNITQEEFEKNVEEAIQALPPSEPHSPNIAFVESKIRSPPTASFPAFPSFPSSSTPTPFSLPSTPSSARQPPPSLHAGEESAEPLALGPASLSDDARRLLQRTGDTISKPLSAISRIFADALDGAENRLAYLPGPFAPFELGREAREASGAASGGGGAGMSGGAGAGMGGMGMGGGGSAGGREAPPQTPLSAGAYGPPPVIQTPYKPRVRRAPPSPTPSLGGYAPDETPSRGGPHTHTPLALGPSQQYLFSPATNTPGVLAPPRWDSAGGTPHLSRTPTPALDLAGVQAQIERAHGDAAAAARATLAQIFPAVDAEVVEWVLEANDGDLGKSIEQLLDISGGE
ncbi:hypothetical protein HYPSUDRAFT_39753 [Hypholoma sublateritium FD-334 SS-4]|uniref:VPS9 domain-containing protein n=1 Tax=Hypholoma sublateritium (strain FD-334 SS-4) TaxID=945553 RepID=A0A0D2NXS8_HYPSF|nr:hypothetical protein HYPSUDRAFT_39753 [Hypholoma sublateritium FD-334 SS-4]